jgi:hypothetical protein
MILKVFIDVKLHKVLEKEQIMKNNLALRKRFKRVIAITP